MSQGTYTRRSVTPGERAQRFLLPYHRDLGVHPDDEPRGLWQHKLSSIIGVFVFIMLSGCAQPQSWDDYASRSQTFKLFTIVPCNDKLSELPTHKAYFQAGYFGPLAYNQALVLVGYWSSKEKPEYEVLYIRYVEHVGLRDFTAVPIGSPPAYAKDAKCAAVAVLPYTVDVGPFYLPASPGQLKAEAARRLWISAAAAAAGLFVLLQLAKWASAGYLRSEVESRAMCRGSLLLLIVVNAATWWLLLWNISERIEQALSYYAWIAQLPHAGADLLPLSWSQALTLMSGPGTSPVTSPGDTESFLKILIITGAVWILLYSKRIAIGFAYLNLIPDPLAELRARAHIQGRVISAEEYVNALTSTAAGLSAWRLELLVKKMQEEIEE